MTKIEVTKHLEEKGVTVLNMRMRNGMPHASISYRDYPKIAPCVPADKHLFHDFDVSLRS